MSEEKKQKIENVREYFRINYVARDAPIFEWGKNKLVVLDVSEAGVRFLPTPGMLIPEKDVIAGNVVFPKRRGTVAVRGQLVRATPEYVVVAFLDDGRIPLARIMEEQRFLIAHGKL